MFLSYHCPLGHLGPWRRLHGNSENAATPASLETREGGAGSRQTPPPHPPAPPVRAQTAPPTSRAQAQPRESRRAQRPASQSGAARPRHPIGCGQGGGGPRQRAVDSRWRRPGGGFQPSRRKGQECGGDPACRVRSWQGQWRALQPARRGPGQGSGVKRRYRLPSLSQPPPFCAAALAHLPCPFWGLQGRPRGDEADAVPPSLYLHSLPLRPGSPSPATTVTQTWARPASSPALGRAPPDPSPIRAHVPALAPARSGRCNSSGAPPLQASDRRNDTPISRAQWPWTHCGWSTLKELGHRPVCSGAYVGDPVPRSPARVPGTPRTARQEEQEFALSLTRYSVVKLGPLGSRGRLQSSRSAGRAHPTFLFEEVLPSCPPSCPPASTS